MSSTLSWIVHDSRAREQAQQLLSLFLVRESRDELGLGSIRDSFADQLFPGTSTIQTRLRYMFFIPWIYRDLENFVAQGRVTPKDFEAEAEKKEKELLGVLTKAEDNSGAYGKTAGTNLKRLPSSVYWAGLGIWGIRRIRQLSQAGYYHSIGEISARHHDRKIQERFSVSGDDDEVDVANLIWHRDLPPRPASFPKQADFALTRIEADFILECLGDNCGDSLLYVLSDRCRQYCSENGPDFGSAPWEYSGYETLSAAHKNLLHHARLFSLVMNGAALSYNFQLAKLREEKGYPGQKKSLSADDYNERFATWINKVKEIKESMNDWNLKELWRLTEGHGHTISLKTREFVESWVELVRTEGRQDRYPNSLLDGDALDLVRKREMFCKNSYSRFENDKALRQWGGEAGTTPFVYRWPQVTRLLQDLYRGFHTLGSKTC